MNKISVIVPIYKVEKYLKKCVDSIIDQTYKNLEIILVDDGSPDNCPSICDEYAKKDKRVKVVHKQNGGLSDARNAGMEIATGKYIGFVDSDDYIHPQMYEKLINSIIENKSDMAMCSFYKIYENDAIEKVIETNLNNVDSSNLFEYYIRNDFYRSKKCLMVDGIMASVWRILYSREMIESVCFDKDCKFCEDMLFNVNVIKPNTKISIVNENLYYYLQRNNSIVHTFNESSINKKMDYIEEITNVMKGKVSEKFFSAFKFNLYVIFCLDLLRCKNKAIYQKYLNIINDKNLNTKENYRNNKQLAKSLRKKIINFLVHKKQWWIIGILLKIKRSFK